MGGLAEHRANTANIGRVLKGLLPVFIFCCLVLTSRSGLALDAGAGWDSLAKDEQQVLSGYAGLPTYNRANALQQYLFVNGRPVRDRLLAGAVRGAYQDFLARDRHPVLALFLEVPAAEVDVNVHPAKAEVRFRDPGVVRGLIVGALRHALDAAGHRASTTVAAAALGAMRPQSYPAFNHKRPTVGGAAEVARAGGSSGAPRPTHDDEPSAKLRCPDPDEEGVSYVSQRPEECEGIVDVPSRDPHVRIRINDDPLLLRSFSHGCLPTPLRGPVECPVDGTGVFRRRPPTGPPR